jgi:His-Xaa-Ser system radical SAM maturase HxsB
MSYDYTLMPFNFEVLSDGYYFLSGLAGDYIFLNQNDFDKMVSNQLEPNSLAFAELEAQKIVTRGSKAAKVLTASSLLSRKVFAFAGPRLHIIVMTRSCNCRCDYCHASSYTPGAKAPHMAIDTAKAISNTIMASPSTELTIEFQGGEPTLEWEMVQFIIEYIRVLNAKFKKDITFVLCTNLLNLNAKMIRYIKKRRIEISTSLDGPQQLHDANRCIPNGSAYEVFLKNLSYLEKETGLKASPLLTVTKNNIEHLREVIDTYLACGRNGIFIRQLNPFGRAILDSSLGYTTVEFTRYYIDALEYILEINKKGTPFREFYLSLYLRRIFSSFDDGFVDLKFPAGSGLSVLVYDVDGTVYPSDEARMMAAVGDDRLKLGNVHSMGIRQIANSSIAKEIMASSISSLIPGCTSCPYAPYCGVDPIKIYSETGQFMQPIESSECERNREVFRWIFKKIRFADSSLLDILHRMTA